MNVHYKLTIKLEELLAGFVRTIHLYKDQVCISSDHYFNPCNALVIEGKGLYSLSCEKQKDLHIHFDIEYTDNDRFAKYVDVMRKVLKMPTPTQYPKEETPENYISITSGNNLSL
jgi:DnaJ-class molecular chaperone